MVRERETQGQIQLFGAEENQTFPMDVFIPSSAVSSVLIGSAGVSWYQRNSCPTEGQCSLGGGKNKKKNADKW